jgi:SAM-dependent methyltransferase
MLTQENQDRIWRHYQTDATGIFDLSDPRMRFLARRCAAGTRVLNIGVGSGKLEELLLRRGVEMYSLDPSDKTIELLRARLGMGDRARQGYGEKIPFDAAFFDRVIMTEVLEHLPDDTLHATLSEVQRVLRPGGDLIGTVPYREDLSANIVICPHCDGRFHRWGHHQRFDTPSLRALLQRHGFVIKRLYPRVFPDFRRAQPFQFLKSIIRYVLGLMGEPMAAPNLYFRAGNR